MHIPIFGSDQIADVTGAGDTVIATMTLALAAGATFSEAAHLANYAGGARRDEARHRDRLSRRAAPGRALQWSESLPGGHRSGGIIQSTQWDISSHARISSIACAPTALRA